MHRISVEAGYLCMRSYVPRGVELDVQSKEQQRMEYSYDWNETQEWDQEGKEKKNFSNLIEIPSSNTTSTS